MLYSSITLYVMLLISSMRLIYIDVLVQFWFNSWLQSSIYLPKIKPFTMQVKSVLPGIENKELLILPQVLRVDSFGRAYVGRHHAGKKGLLLLVELREDELRKFEK